MVTIHTDKTGRKFEIHTNIFGSIVKQVEIFDAPIEDAIEDTAKDTAKDVIEEVIAKPAKRKGKK